MQAHILAHFIHEGKEAPNFPFLCLTVSGGHTQIVKIDSPSKMQVIGTTLDDAAGEAFDKSAKILVLSAHEDSVHPTRVLAAGALGYVTKRSAAEELIKAIRTIKSGKKFLEPIIAQQMAITQLSGEDNPIEILSDREFEVFMSLAKGKSTNEIADTMCLSPRTVGTHLYNIKQKLNANNSAEIALIAIRCGLLEP